MGSAPVAAPAVAAPSRVGKKAGNNHIVRSLAERFWLKVVKTDGCWFWTGSQDKHGYGRITRGRRGDGRLKAHRAAWELVNGPFDYNLEVLHRCDNPPCVRPDHLELGTHAKNMRDAAIRGRIASKLTPSDVRQIRKLLANGDGPAVIGRRFGVRDTTIHWIKQGLHWSHVTDEEVA